MSKKKQKNWLRSFFIIVLLMIITNYLLDLEFFAAYEKYILIAKKISTSLFLILIVYLIKRIIDRIITSKAQTEGDQYNLQRVTRLATIMIIFAIAGSVFFENLYAVALSFGVVSIILGFALQAPITSFIAWLYIVFRRPYQVGNRIQIKHIRGDVIEINYLDTIVWECRGDYLKNDQRTGRVVTFPNSLILKEEVINYAGPYAPFIWNQVTIQIAYTSDLDFVEEVLLKVANEDFNQRYPSTTEARRELLKANVFFKTSDYAWVEAVITYPVDPLDTTVRRNLILKDSLPILNQYPQRVQFPEGTKR